MSTNNLLTGEQLISLKSKSDRDLPHIGEKEFSPSNSWLEKTQIENALVERKHLLEEQRVEKTNSLSCATWIPEAAKAKVLKKVGKHWESLGHHLDGSDWIYPEEALVLLETNCLELILYEVPLSIERAYSTLINHKNGCNFDEYRVYSHLVRNGYRLFRHSSAVSVTRYEKDIHLQQHVLNDKRLYSADCDKSKTVVKETIVNNERSTSPNISVDSVVECRSVSENVEESNSSSCDIVAEKSVSSIQSVSDHQSVDRSAPETEANVDVVSLEADEPDISIVETVPRSQTASKGSDKSNVIDLSSGEDNDSASSDDEDDEEEEDDSDDDDDERDSDDDSIVEVPIREKEIIYAEISSDESVTEINGDREKEQHVEHDNNEEEEEEENEDDDEDDDDENDSDSEDSGGANWKRRQQSNAPQGASTQVNAINPANQSSSTSTVAHQNPIPVCTPFLTVDEFLFPRPDQPNYRVVVDRSNNSLNREVSRFYEEIEVIDLDSDKEDETVAPQVEVLPRSDILQMLPVLRGNSFKFSAPDKYLPDGVKPIKKNYNGNFSLDNWTVIRGDNNYQRNNSRQKNTSHFNKFLESRMRMRNNVIVQRSNPSHQQLLHTPQNRIHPMNQTANFRGAPSPFMNNPVLDQFNSFANNMQQMVSYMVDGTVKNEFQQHLQQAFRNQPIQFQRQIQEAFNDQTIQFQQHLHQALDNQTIQFQQQLQHTFNNQPNNSFSSPSLFGAPPSLLGAPPGFGGPPFPHNNFIPLMPNNPNFNAMNNPAQTDFLGFHVKTENNQGLLNPPNLLTPQQNANYNLPQNANLDGRDGNANSAGTSSNAGANPNTNPHEYLRFLMSLPGKRGKLNRKRRQFMKRLRKFLSISNRDEALSKENVIVKTENQTNRAVNVKTEKQSRSNNRRKGNQKMNNMMENDPLSSQIIFDTTGGDPAVFVEDIPLVIPAPDRSNAATSSPKKGRKRKRKNSMMNKVRDIFAKRVKPDPESVEEVSIISDSAQESSGPFRRENRRRYFGLRNGKRLINRESRSVDRVSTFDEVDVINADIILIDQRNAPRIKSESDPITIVDDSQPAVVVCKPEPVKEVDRKPQIENMEVVEMNGRNVVVEVKQEVVDTSTGVKAEPQSADEVRDKVVDSTTTSVPPIKTENVDESNATSVRETSEMSCGDAVSWAQLKENSPARAAPPQSSLSDSEDDSSSDDDPDVVQPILKPRNCQSLGTVLKALQVFQPASFPAECIETLKITFDVYIPSPSFKKSTRGLPNYRLVVRSCSDPFLSSEQMAELNERFEDCVPILLAVVLPDSISFSTCGLVNLPTLNEID